VQRLRSRCGGEFVDSTNSAELEFCHLRPPARANRGSEIGKRDGRRLRFPFKATRRGQLGYVPRIPGLLGGIGWRRARLRLGHEHEEGGAAATWVHSSAKRERRARGYSGFGPAHVTREEIRGSAQFGPSARERGSRPARTGLQATSSR
jgi:hypothetical protein